MAVIAPTINTDHGDYRVITWANLANGDSGTPVEIVGFSDRSVQVVGTFGAAGSVTAEGSNDGTNYAALSDPQGSAITRTAVGVKAVSELTRYFRPRVTAGDVTTALTVIALFRRSV